MDLSVQAMFTISIWQWVFISHFSGKIKQARNSKREEGNEEREVSICASWGGDSEELYLLPGWTLASTRCATALQQITQEPGLQAGLG